MVLTEEMIRNLPVMTEEEERMLEENRLHFDEWVEEILDDVTRECSKMMSEWLLEDFPNLTLDFIEHDAKTDSSHPIRLQFENYLYIDEARFLLRGKISREHKPLREGTIEYNYDTQEFWHISYSETTKRSRRLHLLTAVSTDLINKVVDYIGRIDYGR